MWTNKERPYAQRAAASDAQDLHAIRKRCETHRAGVLLLRSSPREALVTESRRRLVREHEPMGSASPRA